MKGVRMWLWSMRPQSPRINPEMLSPIWTSLPWSITSIPINGLTKSTTKPWSSLEERMVWICRQECLSVSMTNTRSSFTTKHLLQMPMGSMLVTLMSIMTQLLWPVYPAQAHLSIRPPCHRKTPVLLVQIFIHPEIGIASIRLFGRCSALVMYLILLVAQAQSLLAPLQASLSLPQAQLLFLLLLLLLRIDLLHLLPLPRLSFDRISLRAMEASLQGEKSLSE